MKTIIVPIDFSAESLNGLNLALMLAEKTDAHIQMIYVMVRNDHSSDEAVQKEQQLATLKFKDIIKNYKEKGVLKTELNFVIKEGKVFKEVAAFAETFEDAMTVLSTHGDSGFEELFIGGNAYKLTSHSKNPVITVRRSKTVSNINTIVMPLDVTFQTREKVPYTVNLAKKFNSTIHLVTVTTTGSSSIEEKLHQYTEQVVQYINYENVPCIITHLQGENLTDITLDYARTIDADLISIMTEQEKSLSNLLLGSYAHQMINKAFIPVLSFPNYHLRITTDDIWTLGAFNPRS